MSFIGALFKKPKAPDNPLQLQLSSNSPRKLLLGKTATAGDFVYHGLSNDSRDLTRVIALAGHRCNAVTKIWADGQQVYTGRMQHGVRISLPALNSRKKNYPQFWITWFDGRSDQTADPWLRSTYHSPVSWGFNDRLRGCSYVTITMRHHEGDIDTVLDMIFEVEGALLYDRRLDSTAGGSGNQRWNNPASWSYTDNAAVATDHYQLGMVGGAGNDKLIFGMGLKTWQVPYDEFEANADTCDESVWGLSRYAVNGILKASDDHKDNIVKLAEAMASVPYDTGGRVIIRPQQARTVRLTLSDADLFGKASADLSESPGGDDLVNTVKGEYREPAVRHHSQEYPQVQDAALVSEDGRPFEVTLDLPLETSSARAQRLATIELEVQKRRDIIDETFMPIANVLSVGDWFTRESNLRGPVTKTYEVIDKQVNPDLTVKIVARETDPSVTAFGENQARPVDTPDPLGPFDPDRPDPPAATGSGDEDTGGGATQPTGTVTLNPPIDPVDGERYDYYEVEYGLSAGGARPSIVAGSERTAVFANEDQTLLRLPGLLPSTTYAWRLRTVSGNEYSEWTVYAEFTTTADFISTNTQAVGGVPAVNVLSDIADATQAILDEAQDRIDGDAAEASARAADLIQEAANRQDAIDEVDTRISGVIAGFLGSPAADGSAPVNFNDLSIWSRTISTTDKDKHLALLVDGVPAYASTTGRLLRLALATACDGGEQIEVVARFKALTDGTSSGGRVRTFAYYWDAAGTTRVGVQSFTNQVITVADGIVTHTFTLSVPSDARWYSPYAFINIGGTDAHLAMLDIQYGGEATDAVLGTVFAAIAEQAEVSANADGALAEELATVKATADDAATSGQLVSEQQARATAVDALAQNLGVVSATAGEANSRSLTNQQAITDADSANVERFEFIEATLDALAGSPLNVNPNFNDWADPAAMPADWASFGTSTVTRQTGEDGDYAIRVQTAKGGFSGFTQTVDVDAEDYTFRVKLKGISSNLNDCGVWLRIFDANGNSLVTHQKLLQDHADVDGLTSAAVADYREWQFAIPAQAGAVTAWVRFYGHFSAAGPANAIQIDRLDLFGGDADSADVSFIRSALSDANGNFARIILNAAAGAARTFLEFTSIQRSDGSIESNIGLGARRFEVSNPVNGLWYKALEIVNGVVTVFGDLNALGAMRFGSRRIAVALQGFTVANLSDGDTVSFGGDLTNIPDYEFSLSGLDPLAAMEEYDLTLTSLTSTGGTVRAKIIGGGTPTSYFDSGSTAGSGSEPDEVLHKGNAADATNGNYTFRPTIQANYIAGDGGLFFASGQLEFFVRSGGAWISLGTDSWYDERAGSGGSHSSSGLNYVKNFSGQIGQISDQEYGASVVSGSITAINSFTVAYSNTAAATTRTATPSGRKATVRIIPKNG